MHAPDDRSIAPSAFTLSLSRRRMLGLLLTLPLTAVAAKSGVLAAAADPVPPSPGEVADFTDGLAPILHDRHYRYIDHTGALAIPFRYTVESHSDFDLRAHFAHGLAAITVDGKWGYIDTIGATVIPPQFDYAGPFTVEERAVVEQGKQYGYIDRTDAFVIPAHDESTANFSDGLAHVRIRGKVGFIDPTGASVIAPQFVPEEPVIAG